MLWSRHSVESEWVKCEAAAAAERDVLVPAAIDKVRLPLEFRRRQTADLIRWRGESEHPGYRMLCEGLAAKIGCEVPLPVATADRDAAPGTLPPETIGMERAESFEGSIGRGAGRRIGWRIVGIAVGVLAIAGVAAALLIPRVGRQPEPQPEVKAAPPADSAVVRPVEPPHEPSAGATRPRPTSGSSSPDTGPTGAAKAPSSAAPPATAKPKPPQGTAATEDCRMDALRRLQQGEITLVNAAEARKGGAHGSRSLAARRHDLGGRCLCSPGGPDSDTRTGAVCDPDACVTGTAASHSCSPI